MATTSGRAYPPENNQKLKIIEVSSEVHGDSPKKINYPSILKPKSCNSNVERVPPKLVVMLHRELSITWKS